MSDLHFVTRVVRADGPGRVVHIATDRFGHLYTIGINLDGTDGFAAVYDPATLETRYAETCFGCRTHADELKRHLQGFADLAEDLHLHPTTH